MMASFTFHLVTLITVIIAVVDAAPDLSVCDPSDQPYPYDGPPLPTLPSQYRLKVEATITNRHYSFILEEFYDEINNRGASVSKSRGQTHYTTYDYARNQTLQVTTDDATGTSSCRVSGFSRFSLFGFHVENGSGHINGTNAVFRFGEEYNETYMGMTTVRGIPANHWQRCVYAPGANITFRLDFYFSNASFHLQSGANAIPLRATINGSAVNRTTQQMYNFYHNYEYLEVEPGPITLERAFEPPLGVLCEGYNRTKKFPDFPSVFGVSLESMTPGYNWIHFSREFYSFPANMFALVHEPIGNSSQNATAIREVHDFNAGLSYRFEYGTDKCTIGPIPVDTFMHDADSPDGKRVVLKSPTSFLLPNQSSWIYQGNTTLRGIDVEGWITATNITIGPLVWNATMEYFFARGNWTGGTDQTGLVHQMPLQFKSSLTADVGGFPVNVVHIQNMFHYTYHISSYVFDVHLCYNEEDSRSMAVEILGMDIRKNYIVNNTQNFYAAVQHAMANASGLPASRIGNVYAAEGVEEILIVYFDMLGLPPVEGNAVNPKHGPELAEALVTLEERVLGKDPIRINFTRDGKDVTLIVGRGSLRFDFHPPSDDNEGVGRGAAAGIGIGMFLLGAIIATLIAVAYVKRSSFPPPPYGVQG
ncbi:uncharacterized protein LOC129266666 [Lytechinus pictus]|uniref:uncharacterized protein LOC129266666 n=1 Tax=Lytechinus pictus TaxID=7653 RepID=UPI0030B9C4D7